jgi:acyl-CoA thioester hydrolase
MTAPLFRHSHRVTYAQCTLGNHVYYARYLDFLESARGEFFRHLRAPLLDWQEQDVIFPVTECRLAYLAPAHYDEELTIVLWLNHLDRLRLEFGYEILRGETSVLVQAATQHVCTSVREKPKRMPKALEALLRPFLKSETAALG